MWEHFTWISKQQNKKSSETLFNPLEPWQKQNDKLVLKYNLKHQHNWN